MRRVNLLSLLLGCFCLLNAVSVFADDSKPKVEPKPKRKIVPVVVKHDPAAKQILNLPGTGVDESKIDYTKLPKVKGTAAVICPYDKEVWKFQLHNYLIHHDGQYWAMWSHGPGEDEPTQRVRFATSPDGLKWSESNFITPPPEEGFAYIARGFWLRDGELLALVAHFKGKGAFGADKHLKLEAYSWNPQEKAWKFKGVTYDNAINNFPPEKLPSGEWMTTRRDPSFNVTVLIGGLKSFDDWQVFPVVKFKDDGQRPDEPIWYTAKDQTLVALFRDNSAKNHLYHATSKDLGRNWTVPEISNFPNPPAKLFALKTSLGCYVLISNANPKIGRQYLYVSLSDDGHTFTRMAHLDTPATPGIVNYPHAIEHDGHLFITYSRLKRSSEVMKIPLSEIEKLRK